MQIIRNTPSVCPKYIKKIKADIVEKDGKVYMLKGCQKHGKFDILLSNDKKYYRELNKACFMLSSPKKEKKQDVFKKKAKEIQGNMYI